MITVPEERPVTTPEEDTDASDGAPLIQVPPGDASVLVMVLPTQTLDKPVIATGAAITVTVTLVPHPPDAYSILATPGATPVTTPDVAATVATEGAALLQVPPGIGSVNVSVVPTHILPAPTIAVGTEFTVTTTDILQPVLIV